MKKMQFVCFSLVGFMSLQVLTGCGAAAPSSVRELDSVYSGSTQTLYGKLSIAFAAADYSTQATAADVNSLKITLTGEKIATPIVKTIAKDAASSVDFSGLPVGTIALKVQALNAAGAEIGVVNQGDIAIQGGKTTKVSLKLKLNPTVVADDGALNVGVVIEDGDEVTEPTPTPSTAPASSAFSDGFEAGLANWDASFSSGAPVTNWTASSLNASAGTYCATAGDSEGKVETQGTYTLTLKNGIDLSNAANPTLSFKLNNFVPRYYFRNGSLTIEASNDGTWKKVGEVTEAASTWTAVSVSLASVKGSSVKVRFNFNYQSVVTSGKHSAAQIDEVTIN